MSPRLRRSLSTNSEKKLTSNLLAPSLELLSLLTPEQVISLREGPGKRYFRTQSQFHLMTSRPIGRVPSTTLSSIGTRCVTLFGRNFLRTACG